MELRFSQGRLDGPVESHWDALLRVVGTFEIYLGGQLWYREVEFPALEFAQALLRWMRTLDQGPADFVYTSLESEESALLRFVHATGNHWLLSAPHEEYRERRLFPASEIRIALEQFLDELGKSIPERDRVLGALDNPELVERLEAPGT